MMLHVGGPRPEADVRASHQRRLVLMEKGDARMYKIVADDPGEVLGTIGIWKIDWKGPQTYEIVDLDKAEKAELVAARATIDWRFTIPNAVRAVHAR